MNRFFGLLLVGVIAVGLAIGAGFAAYQRASGQPTPPVAASSTAITPTAASSPQAATGVRRVQPAGTTITGTIASASTISLTVKTTNGEQAVQLGSDTTYRRDKPAALADLKPGDPIAATGQRSADGAMTARTIQVGQLANGQRAFIPNSGGGQARSGDRRNGATEADRGTVVGTVKEVSQDSLTIDSPGGQEKITITAETRIDRQETASASDLQAGIPVTVTLREGATPPTAQLVRIGA